MIIRKRLVLILVVWAVFVITLGACGGETAPQKEVEMTISLNSTAFKEGERIPVKYTCDGQNISPPLAWDDLPQNAQTCSLIVDDPDAPGGVFTHWILFNIPRNVRELTEGVPVHERLQNGALQGKNDFGKIGYGGPCPPRGTAHRYRFIIYALDKSLDIKPGASKKQLIEAMQGHTIAQGQLIGIYQR